MDDGRLAVLADIHGSVWALEAVLADIQRREIAAVVVLGDSLYGQIEPAATADVLMERALPSLCGNSDRILYEPAFPSPSPTLEYTRAALAERHLAWLRTRPATRTLLDEVLLCHGTPDSDETYLLEEPTPFGSVLREPAAFAASLRAVAASVVYCAHSHVPCVVVVLGGPVIVNPGSVGAPASTEDVPFPYPMESGSPHARYAILARDQSDATAAGERSPRRAEVVAVPYPWEKAAAVARAHGRPDWRPGWRADAPDSLPYALPATPHGYVSTGLSCADTALYEREERWITAGQPLASASARWMWSTTSRRYVPAASRGLALFAAIARCRIVVERHCYGNQSSGSGV
jgi:predicted phosphodiesterase